MVQLSLRAQGTSIFVYVAILGALQLLCKLYDVVERVAISGNTYNVHHGRQVCGLEAHTLGRACILPPVPGRFGRS